MGPLGKFLLSLSNLVRTGGIRKIEDAFNIAKQEFGEVTPLLRKQIERIFARGKKQEPGIKKEGEVISIKRDKNNLTEDDPMGDLEKIVKGEGNVGLPKKDQASGLESLKNPYRPGGGLDPIEGMTRTAARVVLGRRGIDIPEKKDPIDIFEENFGGDALMDLRDVGEELLEKERTGRITESMGEFLDSRGMFDIKINKDAPKGISNEEMLDLIKGEEMAPKMTERFKLRQKYPGINDELLSDIIDDPDPQNKAEALATLDEAMKLLEEGKGTDEIISILEKLKKTRRDNAEGGLNYLMGM